MFYLDEVTTIDRIGSEVTAAVAATTLRWAIYGDSSGFPGALVLDTGAVGDASTTGFKEATVNQVLQPGRYWLGCIPQGGNPTMRSSSGSIGLPGVGLTSTEIVSLLSAGVGFFVDNITDAAPATFNTAANATAVAPLVWVRKA